MHLGSDGSFLPGKGLLVQLKGMSSLNKQCNSERRPRKARGPVKRYDQRAAYLGSSSSFSACKGVLVQLEGLLLLVQLVEAVLVEKLEVLQLGHLGQAGPTGPAAQHTTFCYRTGVKTKVETKT